MFTWKKYLFMMKIRRRKIIIRTGDVVIDGMRFAVYEREKQKQIKIIKINECLIRNM